jgi:hypothetical protein
MRQLVELVPELKRVEPERVAHEEQAAVAYFRQAVGSLPSLQDEFIDGLSYAAYFALPAAEQDAIWERIFVEDPTGAHDLKEHNAQPNTRVAARQKRRA